jgi:hypothetical protein
MPDGSARGIVQMTDFGTQRRAGAVSVIRAIGTWGAPG